MTLGLAWVGGGSSPAEGSAPDLIGQPATQSRLSLCYRRRMDRNTVPDERVAAEVATLVLESSPRLVTRFETGARHWVYEASLDGTSIVIKLGLADWRPLMVQGQAVQRRLRDLRVPLPTVLATGLADRFPWVAMERLPGSDLDAVMLSLTVPQLKNIAAAVAKAQAAARGFGSAGRYGYAAIAKEAPHRRWSDVLRANLERSESRIRAAGFFDLSLVTELRTRLGRLERMMDRVPPVPFIHDATTRNVIVTDKGQLSGIVDIDDLCFGDPRYPIALTKAVLLGYGGPLAYVDAWLKAAEEEPDEVFAFYVALFLVDLMSEHGIRFNGNERSSTPSLRQQLLTAFDQARLS